MLILGQRAALLLHCADHPIAVCPQCAKAVRVADARTDAFMSHLDYCPQCSADLTAALRTHLAECTWILAEARHTRARAQTIREDARGTAKTSEQLHDRAEVLSAEAEAELQRSQRMKRGPWPASGPGGGEPP
jgi:hypothetical protein